MNFCKSLLLLLLVDFFIFGSSGAMQTQKLESFGTISKGLTTNNIINSPPNPTALIEAKNERLNIFKSRIGLVLCATMYGSNYVCTKILQTHMTPQFVTIVRFVIASVCFLPNFVNKKINYDAIRGGLELGTWCSIGFLSQALSLTQSSASKTAFMCGLSVLFVPILDHIFGTSKNKTHCGICRLIPPIFAFFGIVCLESGESEPAKWSDLLLLVTPIAFAMNFWRAESIVRKYPEDTPIITGASIIMVTICSLIWGMVTSGLPSNYEGWKTTSTILLNNKLFLIGLVYLAVFVTYIASNIEQNALKSLSASETTLIYTLEPLTAAAFAVIILKEHLNATKIIGATFIIGACLYSIFSSIYEIPAEIVR